MNKELELPPLLYKKDRNRERIYIPIVLSLELEKQATLLNMSKNQYIIYILDMYHSNDIDYIKQFRYNLYKRVKKGINTMYIKELKKLRDYINILIKQL